jgi:DNA-binding GntR family transcriptional regulator
MRASKLTRTLVNQIADVFVEMAMAGSFEPGMRIPEGDLAKQLNVSRVPVREALRMLEADGIVTSEPYKGMRFMQIGAKQISDIREVRLQLEILAARLCVERVQDIRTLTNELALHLRAMTLARHENRLLQMTQEDIEFHRTICRHSGNDALLRFWDSAAKQLAVIFGRIHRDARYTTIHEDHRKLLDAFLSRDELVVEKALREHILTAADFVLLHARPETNGGSADRTMALGAPAHLPGGQRGIGDLG